MYLAAYNFGFSRALRDNGYSSVGELTKQASEFARRLSVLDPEDIVDVYTQMTPEEQQVFVSGIGSHIPDEAKRAAVMGKLQPAAAPPPAKLEPKNTPPAPAKTESKAVVNAAPKAPVDFTELIKKIREVPPHDSGFFSKIKGFFSEEPHAGPAAEELGWMANKDVEGVEEFVRPDKGGYEVKRFDTRPGSAGMQSVNVNVPDSVYQSPEAQALLTKSRHEHIPAWAGGGALLGGGLGAGIGALTGDDNEDPYERAGVGGAIGVGVGGLLGGLAGDRRGNAVGRGMLAGRHIDQQAAKAFGRMTGLK